ncbi:hypothetical protein [Streptomyces sp. NPDC001404]|uniref:hypothetical protein n=1 Tax=Streptomyces sp. NPDC001404 TaxID=3364571 RepID=UPI0036A2A89D
MPEAKGPAPVQSPVTDYSELLKTIDTQAAALAKSLESLDSAPDSVKEQLGVWRQPWTPIYMDWKAAKARVPADQVKPEDVGTLSIEYRDGQPVIVVSGGKYIPADIPMVNSTDSAWFTPISYVPSGRPEDPPRGYVLAVNWLMR